MARLTFTTIFEVHTDGTITPKQPIRIGGITLSPGVKIDKGSLYGGVDLTKYTGNDLEVTYDDGTAVITAIY